MGKDELKRQIKMALNLEMVALTAKNNGDLITWVNDHDEIMEILSMRDSEGILTFKGLERCQITTLTYGKDTWCGHIHELSFKEYIALGRPQRLEVTTDYTLRPITF